MRTLHSDLWFLYSFVLSKWSSKDAVYRATVLPETLSGALPFDFQMFGRSFTSSRVRKAISPHEERPTVSNMHHSCTPWSLTTVLGSTPAALSVPANA